MSRANHRGHNVTMFGYWCRISVPICARSNIGAKVNSPAPDWCQNSVNASGLVEAGYGPATK
jgi:hypothetical protein